MAKLEDKIAEFKSTQSNLQQNYKARSQLVSQQQENSLVRTEFEKLEEDAIVYKLVGPVLVKQDVDDAKVNVDKRIEYITNELKRVDGVVENLEKELSDKRAVIGELQQKEQQQGSIEQE
eukprot:GEMP01100357.1.p1 GENE.GEMP01100357.1~~GEMP01100357.1.p1  ORF type:complete len:128 (+),score=34.51 GEMP01100357.1:25-384(+)